ncbi:MAG: addiction module antidote protein, HigA family, partial [bacterium]|nr:addiction module antidote protein, HigA family [bacterium]
MPMKNPPHPGLSVRYDCLDPLGLSVTEAARKLGVSRKQLSDIV